MNFICSRTEDTQTAITKKLLNIWSSASLWEQQPAESHRRQSIVVYTSTNTPTHSPTGVQHLHQVTGQSAVSQWIMMWTSADITNPSATDDGSLKQSKTRVLTCLRQFSGCGLTAAAQHVITANNNIILLFTPSAAGCGLLGTRHHHAMIFNCCAARKDLISNKEPESR